MPKTMLSNGYDEHRSQLESQLIYKNMNCFNWNIQIQRVVVTKLYFDVTITKGWVGNSYLKTRIISMSSNHFYESMAKTKQNNKKPNPQLRK